MTPANSSHLAITCVSYYMCDAGGSVKPELSLRESYPEHKLGIFYGKIKIDMNKESKESIRHFASLDSFSTLNPCCTYILSSLYSVTYAVIYIHTQSHRSPSFTVCHRSSHRPQLLSSEKNPRIDDATRHGKSDWCCYCLRCGSSPGRAAGILAILPQDARNKVRLLQSYIFITFFSRF